MKLVRDMTDEVYHKQLSREEHYYSSSQLKDILKSPTKFRKKYIYGEVEETPARLQSAFDVGTVTHTAILEPHRLDASFIVYPERRAGKAWTDFQKTHKHKIILNEKEHQQVLTAKRGADASERTQEILCAGEAELSLFGELEGIRIKVRGDWTCTNRGLLSDVKTAQGDTGDVEAICKKIDNLDYDLSAALYLDMFHKHSQVHPQKYKKNFAGFKDFYWNFTSKEMEICRSYLASPDMIAVGRAKYMEAIRLIKHYEALNWEFPEEVITLEPTPWDKVKWLKPKEETTAITNTDDL